MKWRSWEFTAVTWRTLGERHLGCRVKHEASVPREAAYEGFCFQPDSVGSCEDTRNRCSKAVTKTRSKSIFLSRREDLCVLKGSCLEQDK